MSGSFCNWTFVQLSNCPFVRIREIVGGRAGGPNNLEFCPYTLITYWQNSYLLFAPPISIFRIPPWFWQMDNWTNVQSQKERFIVENLVYVIVDRYIPTEMFLCLRIEFILYEKKRQSCEEEPAAACLHGLPLISSTVETYQSGRF